MSASAVEMQLNTVGANASALTPSSGTAFADHGPLLGVSATFVGCPSTSGELLARLLGTGVTALAQAPLSFRSAKSDVLVIDGSKNCDRETSALIRLAKDHHRGVAIVFCSSDRLEQATWVETGVDSFSTNQERIGDVIDAISRVASGETVLGVSVREGLLAELRAHRNQISERTAQFQTLTRREADVLRALANGISPEDVARTSFVSLNTIRTQIRGILAKLGTSSMVGAVGLAYRSGWLQPEHIA
jgi:DNA-binding NarL/FixJ family response regulator